MNTDLGTSFSQISMKFNQFIHKYGFIVMFLIVAIGLAASILLLNDVIARTDQANGYVSDINSVTFDQATIDKLKNLSQNEKIDTSNNSRLTPFD